MPIKVEKLNSHRISTTKSTPKRPKWNSIAGGVVLLIGFTTNGGIYKAIGKAFLKNAIAGFYMIVIGWVVAIVGYFSK